MKSYRAHSNEELCLLTKQADENALRALIERNRPFVQTIIRQLTEGKDIPCVTYEELRQEGSIGIYEAAMQFDPNKGYSFLTLAGRVIRNKMLDLIGIYADTYSQVSIEADQQEDDASPGVYEITDRRVDVEGFVVRKIFLEEVRECFLQLSDRQQQILAYKFGIDLSAHPLESEGRDLPDALVAEYFHSKTSLIRKNKEHAYDYIKGELF